MRPIPRPLRFAILAFLPLVFTLVPPFHRFPAANAATMPPLFNSLEESQDDLTYLPQWLSALERHITQDTPEGDCTSPELNQCHLQKWHAFLEEIRNKPRRQQIEAVNSYANKKNYVVDMVNYAAEDYWAIPKEFLYNGGDCEDFAITKFFSLRWLGYLDNDIRLLIIQDTNLHIQHAILMVLDQGKLLVLDNQSQEVVAQEKIRHYVPLYSLNEKQWWVHVPPNQPITDHTP
ncbi:MAG: transglutaminase-like cysteine peptidase [Desulfobulbaceae bacterium]|nr:transglutaminase-like cysteine peptidase [Desulfobulbaceae bacterium]